MERMLHTTGIPLLCALVYFVYPIPHSVALRYLLLAVLLAAGLASLLSRRLPQGFAAAGAVFRGPLWILAALTVWLIVQSAAISPYSGEALRMLRGDWLNALIAGGVGLLSALACRGDQGRRAVHAVAAALALHILALFVYQFSGWIDHGAYPFGKTPFAEKDYHSMLVTTLSALIIADLLSRTLLARRIFPLPRPALLGLLAAVCIASVTLLARNAVIINALLLVFGAVIFLSAKRKTASRIVLPLSIALMLAIGAMVWGGLRSDSRWQGFAESAAAAMDTGNNLAWLDKEVYPLPLMRNGQPVDESAYLRLAWAKVGVEQLAATPLGLGYGHKAFGWAVDRAYGIDSLHESSHCGLLDFALANGIPGLLLWLALSAALFAAGLRAYAGGRSPAGLALALTVFAYLVRCLLDGHLSGFRLAMYAFLVGMLATWQCLEEKRCN